MDSKIVPFQTLWAIIIFILTGCRSIQLETPPILTSTSTPTLTALPPFSTALPKETIEPTSTPTLTPALSKPFSLDRVRMVYVEGGNLYIRDGLNTPIQLTDSGTDQNPVLSDDGKKIVFYRGDDFDTVFSINADGSQERLIIQSETLPVLGQGKVRALTFAPDTHYLLFNTFLCDPPPQGPLYDAKDCTVGIFIVDTDTGEINQLIVGLSGNATQSRNFEVSPNGQMLSIANSGHVDVFFLSSVSIDIIHQDAILYSRTIPDEYLPHVYWLPDSSGFIAILATDEFNEPTTPPKTYAAWRYTWDDDNAIQIPLTATIMFNSGCNFSVSPDRNWIYFVGNESGIVWETPTQYLGNLIDGHEQQYSGGGYCPSTYYSAPKWSPDNRYFASDFASTGTIGSIDGTSMPFNGQFLDWIDSFHYFYQENDEIFIGKIGGESVNLPDGFQWPSTFVILESDTDK